jgi:integrase
VFVLVLLVRKAVKRANARLAADGQTPLPDGLTLHALRRTCASVLVALGKDPRYVMAQLGHTDPTVTLGIYAQAMTSNDDDRERLRLLVEGADLAVDGSGSDIGASASTTTASMAGAESA